VSDTTSAKHVRGGDLTARQREVLDLIARGHTNYEIAEVLGISLAGAKWHVSEVLSKLGVGSREEAARYWRRRNRPVARFERAVRGLVAGPLLKVAGAAALGSAGVFVLATTLNSVSDDPPAAADETATPAEALATNGIRDFTVDEATEIALRLGAEHLSSARSGREVGRAQVDGRPVQIEDLILRARLFEPLTSSVTFGDAGRANFTSGTPSDRWGFLFELDGLTHPELPDSPADLRLYLVFEDGTGNLTDLSSEIDAGVLSPSADTMERAARGEDVSWEGEAMASSRAVPHVFVIRDEGLRRMSLSVYGDPSNPCLRFDDTATPDSIGRLCPAKNVRGGALYSMMSGTDFVVGTAAPETASVVAVNNEGEEAAVPLYPLPADYEGTMKAFLGSTGGAVSLQLRDANGATLSTIPFPRPDAGVAPTTRSVRGFGMEEEGSATSSEFAIQDSPLGYAFIFEFASPVPVVLRALCDAGEMVVLDSMGPLEHGQSSLVINFPSGSTACRLRVETEPTAEWRLYSK